MKLIPALYARFGILIWVACLAIECASLGILYHKRGMYRALNTMVTLSAQALKLTEHWKITQTVAPQHLSHITQEIRNMAKYFDTIQLTFREGDEDAQKKFCEMTMSFTLKHDDIFWKFFIALHKKYRGRIYSTELSLCKEEREACDSVTEPIRTSEEHSLFLKGRYTARWYYF
jgi:hypothetical protein